MNTPRSGLIRATEKAIQEFIEDSCERNLPLIQKLEEFSYNIWVESNTDFLQHSLSLEDDDDGDDYIWDDDCMPSFTEFELTPLDDDVDDDQDVSSIGSSIKPCDESDCWIGYLAGSEDEDDLDRRLKCHVTDIDHCSLESNNAGINQHERRNTVNYQCIRSIKRRLRKREDTKRSLKKEESQNEWVVVNSDLSEHIFSNSTSESSLPNSDLPFKNSGVYSVINNQWSVSKSEGSNSEEFSSDIDSDTEEWDVISMDIKDSVYSKTRRRLFTSKVEKKTQEFDDIPLYSDNNVLTYIDSLFDQSHGWVLVRFLLRVIGCLLQKYG